MLPQGDYYTVDQEATNPLTVPRYIKGLLFLTLSAVVITQWPHVIPFQLFQFWYFHPQLASLFSDLWPMLVGMFIMMLLWTFSPLLEVQRELYWQSLYYNGHPRFIGVTIVMIAVGVLEEIYYRWLLFYAAIVLITVANFLCLGFMGYDIIQWCYLHLFAPIADFFTFYKIHDILFSAQYSWTVGAAVLFSNGRFRKGHAYQGIFGWTWSWFLGIFFFLVMFKYGIVTGMIVHTLYNILVTYIQYILFRLFYD